MDNTEREDFVRILAEHGMSENDFDYTERNLPMSKEGISFVQGEITIIRKSTGKSRTYRSGYASTWLADFDRDLRAGVFK